MGNISTKEKVARDVQEQHARYLPVWGGQPIGLGAVVKIDCDRNITFCRDLKRNFAWVRYLIGVSLQIKIPFRRIGKAISAVSVVEGNASNSKRVLTIDGIENGGDTNEIVDSTEVRKGKIVCEFTEAFSYVIEMENVYQSELDENTSAAFIDYLGEEELLVTGVIKVFGCDTSKAACIVTKGKGAKFTIEASYAPKLHGVFYAAARSNQVENTFDTQIYGPNRTVLIKVTTKAHLEQHLKDETIKEQVNAMVAEAKAKEESSGQFNGLRKSILSMFSGGSYTSDALQPAAMAAPGASLAEIKAHLVEASGASLKEIAAHLVDPSGASLEEITAHLVEPSGASLEEITAHLVEPSGASLEEITAHLVEPSGTSLEEITAHLVDPKLQS